MEEGGNAGLGTANRFPVMCISNNTSKCLKF
jgi:hypothetical protein